MSEDQAVDQANKGPQKTTAEARLQSALDNLLEAFEINAKVERLEQASQRVTRRLLWEKDWLMSELVRVSEYSADDVEARLIDAWGRRNHGTED